MTMLVAVDTGGTKTLIAGFSQDGIAGKLIKIPTPKDQDEYIKELRGVLRKTYGGQRVEAVVVAMPGIVKNGVAVWCNNLGWSNFDVAKQLQGVLGLAPIIIENDANLAGLAETRTLDTLPTSSLYVTVSTGIGTGVITNGKIDPGLRHSEGGRALVEYDGVVREWESFASGRAIHATYGKFARDIHSKHTWNEIADRISRGFLAVVPIIQPDVVIIGGSIGTYFDQYGMQLENILREKLPAHIPCPTFLQASHPEQAVIYGCYYYALDTLAD
jgi:predicted NBD/HSP70 family sugar kinase